MLFRGTVVKDDNIILLKSGQLITDKTSLRIKGPPVTWALGEKREWNANGGEKEQQVAKEEKE